MSSGLIIIGWNLINIPELIGYAASVLVAVSLTMKGILKLRLLNLIGAVFFTIYGFIISAYPIVFVNGFICFINLYYLFDIFKIKEFFRILEVHHDSEYLDYFLQFHKTEIKKYMPDFQLPPENHSVVFFILRNSIPAGLIYAERRNDSSLFIDLDFVIPGYRDLKIGKYVYNNIFNFTGVNRLYSYSGSPKHENYLRKMGFERCVLESKPVYCLERV